MKIDITILGGGISGLSCAYFLQQRNPKLNLLLLEPRSSLGGWIQSITLPSGQNYETGPRTLRLRGESALSTNKLITSLGLENEVIKAAKTSHSRYVILDGIPTPLPEGFSDLFCTKTGRELARLSFLEPFRKKGSPEDESVASFFSRRAPSPLVAKLADALVTGIWAARADDLSIYHTFPEMKEWELSFGSTLIGGIRAAFSKKEKPKIRGICSFKKGLSQLVDALQEKLSIPMHINTIIDKIGPNNTLHTSLGPIKSEKIVFALPEKDLNKLAPQFSKESFPHTSIASVTMGWEEDLLSQKGFGTLAPEIEDASVLGIIYDSCLFPEHNTYMKTRLTVLIGGARWPEAVDESDETLFDLALSRILKWTGITKAPTEYKVLRAKNCIPHPPVGASRPTPFLQSPCATQFAINPAIGGVSVNNCIHSAHMLTTVLATDTN